MPAFPYLAKATIKYKSPHKQDLTFAKGETIRVTGIAPKTDPSEDDDDDDDDDWLVGETLDGSRSGTFPGGFVEPTEEVEEDETSHQADATIASATSAPAAPGAIPTEAPTNLQSSVIEETPTHQADTIPQAAREAAQKGETEEAGFGAPLPPRPPSPDADEDEEEAAQPNEASGISSATNKPSEGASDTSKVAGGAAAVGVAATGAAAAIGESSSKEPSRDAAPPAASTAEAKSDPAPAKSPPTVASKPPGMSSSFRDRLAAFNKPAEAAPPPLPKGKPGGWKRPTPASTEAKPLLPGAPASASTTAKPAALTQPVETKESTNSAEPSGASGGAFSAADAQSSIKMSLKERMAALQRNEAAAADTAPELKPKPSVPGKIGADRRNVALQGMGLAPGASVPVRKSSVGSGTATEEAAVEPTADQAGSEQDATAAPVAEEVSRDTTDPVASEASVTDEAQENLEESGEPKEALTEEEQEAERRAAIAKRMAALGARRMGGAPVPFGAPAPPKRTQTTSSVGSTEGTTSEPGINVPAEPAAAATSSTGEAKEAIVSPSSEVAAAEPLSASQEANEEPKVLAVPRRTAAPRKRKPVPQAAAAATAGATASAVGTAAAIEESETQAPAANTESEVAQSVHGSTEAAVVPEESAADAPAEKATGKLDEPVHDVTASHDETGHSAALEAEDASHTEQAIPTATEPESSDEQQDEEDPEIAENQRQLEEYLRGEGFYEDQVEPPAQHEAEAEAAAVPAETHFAQAHVAETGDESVHAAESVPRDDITFPKPPSRPPSTRPPVPKTNLPPPPAAGDQDDATFARVASPPAASMSRRGSAIPPVPTTSLPTPKESAADEIEGPVSHTTQDEEETEVTGPVLAVPRPRMAIPTEDPEDEELLASANAPAAPGQTTEAQEAASEQEPDQEEELTEEEQEAQRRANLARRMAALGGQRIGAFPGMAPPPIMGAPMPARKAPVQTSDETEGAAEPESQVDQEAPLSPIRGPPRGGMAIPGLTAVPGMNAQQAEGDALERARSPGAASVDAPARLASPPPVPTSPPPKPMSPPPPARPLPTAGDATLPPLPPGRPSSTAPMANLDEAIRSASPANSSLGRRTSMKPPVPQGIGAHSRDSSAVAEYEPTEDRELATSPPPLPVSPPPLPVSPPPRPSSRAPPLPGHAGVPPRRQGSSASYTSYGAGEKEVPATPSATTNPAVEPPAAPMVAPRTESSLPPTPAAGGAPSNISVGARQSFRDLDLMPSSRWWRHGVNPLRLPPTVAGRPDAILYADTSSNPDEAGIHVHKADIYMLFEDYSTTVISLSFQDDDLDETHTSLTQRHSFPPAKPSLSDLKQWSSSIGSAIAKIASDTAKQSSSPVGDGSPRALIQTILSSIPTALPPVGASLGCPILTQVGPTIMEAPTDEVRPGDIVSCTTADFKGKKGLAPYHMTFGSQSDPTLGIVVEVETKKNKLRCIIQSPNNKRGLPDEVSLRLDDLKSGIVKVFRVPPRQGWVNDW
ncbi:uncharacterized protein UTRI_00564_B [Ustilago trichophora]|uniref:SH3 domain-containing protein n=1 Tax=Ustilago trichophora TaxID=86804 RepID=A0A5C3DSK1_9BASI|nr:uncharacterized protein UTRI_00564_B [Ustilago trichophora]